MRLAIAWPCILFVSLPWQPIDDLHTGYRNSTPSLAWPIPANEAVVVAPPPPPRFAFQRNISIPSQVRRQNKDKPQQKGPKKEAVNVGHTPVYGGICCDKKGKTKPPSRVRRQNKSSQPKSRGKKSDAVYNPLDIPIFGGSVQGQKKPPRWDFSHAGWGGEFVVRLGHTQNQLTVPHTSSNQVWTRWFENVKKKSVGVLFFWRVLFQVRHIILQGLATLTLVTRAISKFGAIANICFLRRFGQNSVYSP